MTKTAATLYVYDIKDKYEQLHDVSPIVFDPQLSNIYINPNFGYAGHYRIWSWLGDQDKIMQEIYDRDYFQGYFVPAGKRNPLTSKLMDEDALTWYDSPPPHPVEKGIISALRSTFGGNKLSWAELPYNPSLSPLWHGEAFGFVNGKLYFGAKHHLTIMNELAGEMGFEALMNAEQAWGWVMADEDDWFESGEDAMALSEWLIRFYSDEGRHDEAAIQKALTALERNFPEKKITLLIEPKTLSPAKYAPRVERQPNDPGYTDYVMNNLGIRSVLKDDVGNLWYVTNITGYFGNSLNWHLTNEQTGENDIIENDDLKARIEAGDLTLFKISKIRILGYETEKGQLEMFPEIMTGTLYTWEQIRQKGLNGSIPFGFVNGILYIGQAHHMAIMNWLINNGMDWEELLEAEQAWGWIRSDIITPAVGRKNSPLLYGFPIYLDSARLYQVRVDFMTDAGKLDQAAMEGAVDAIQRKYNVVVRKNTESFQPTEYAPNWEKSYGEEGTFKKNPLIDVTVARKISDVYSEIKFVSLPDRILIGENTYHAHLLHVEYGNAFFPVDTIAIGRALVQNDVIVEVSFDFGPEPEDRMHAYKQLEEYAEQQGYQFAPDENGWIQGLATTGPSNIAFAFIGGKMYYGTHHAEIIDRYFYHHDTDEIQGIFGYLDRFDSKEYTVHIYSDLMRANQSTKDMGRALNVLRRDYKIKSVEEEAPDWTQEIDADLAEWA